MYLGVVPARSGSKRIPHKNLVTLRGVPLIDYTLRAAARSRRLDAHVVSTDSEAIAKHARSLGSAVPALRPAAIAGDHSPTVEALRHALETFEAAGGAHADAVVVLQPTSPFRSAEDIDRAIELFEGSRADTVTAVRAASNHPYWTWRKEAEGIVPFFSLAEMGMDRQMLPEAYAENGAIYVVRRDLVLAGTLYGERVMPYLMNDVASTDIDTLLDLAWAEFLLARGIQQVAPE